MYKTKTLKSALTTKLKIIFWVTLGMLLLFTVTPRGYAQSVDADEPAQAAQASADEEPTTFPYKKNFLISSYYSPLPGQSKYFTGSFEGDVRLNGEGVTAADGTKVYPGMAAAPKRFQFGTKMTISGFGLVAIHDRGGAIKSDRLDIWMGSGEEGLRRAISWGMRTVEVTVHGIDDTLQESVDFTVVPLAEMNWVSTKTTYFKKDLGYGDEGESVRALQRTLKQTGQFQSDVTGFFGDETQAALVKFQMDENVISSDKDAGAGNFGPKSRIALERALDRLKNEALNSIPSAGLRIGNSGEEVAKLQSLLKNFGYLNEVTGKFDKNTQDGLLRFQQDFSIVSGRNETGAGYFGPKTQSSLKALISYNYSPESSLATIKLATGNVEEKLISKPLAFNDKGDEVKLLQEELSKLNFLKLRPTGYYGKTTEHAVLKFQQAFKIVENEKSEGAGVVGPKTIEKLNALYIERAAQQKQIAKVTDEKKMVAARISDEKNLLIGNVSALGPFSTDLIYGARGRDVENLQKILKRLGFFQGKITTAYFGEITKGSLMAFQKNHGIESSGALDLSTRRVLNTIVSEA